MRLIVIPVLLLFATLTARAGDYATALLDCTFKLYQKDSTATCFLLHRDDAPKEILLITAAHVFEKMSGDEALLVLRTLQEDGTYKRKDYPIKTRVEKKPLWFKHPTLDIAVYKIPADPAVNLPSLPVSRLADEASIRELRLHTCSSIFVYGYPTRFEANNAGFPIGRHASIASYPLIPVQHHKTFLADFNTFEGDSGGPVFTPDARTAKGGEAEQPLIMGLILSQFRHDSKVSTLYEERTIHYPLNISTVVQAPMIRETIELSLKP